MSSSSLCRRQLLRHTARPAGRSHTSTTTAAVARSIRQHTTSISNAQHSTSSSSTSQQHNSKRSTVLFTTTAVAGLSGAILYNQFVSNAHSDLLAAHAAGRLNQSAGSTSSNSSSPDQHHESDLHSLSQNASSNAPAETQQHPKRSAVQRPKSEPKYAHPQYPGMLRLVADNIDELVYNTPDRLTLVEVYETGCGACATLSPVIQLLAKCFRDNGVKVDVALYEGALNYKPGFLTEEEDRAVPVIKLFTPQSKQQQQGITYDGNPNAKEILEFIHEQSKSDSKASFDLQKLSDCVTKNEPPYFEKVIKQTRKRLQQDPTAFLYAQSPCGPYMQQWMEMMMSSMYLSNKSEDRNKAQQIVFNDFRDCMSEKSDQSIEYWSSVKDVAEQNLSDAVERKKTDADAAAEAKKDESTQRKPKRNPFGGSAPRSK